MHVLCYRLLILTLFLATATYKLYWETVLAGVAVRLSEENVIETAASRGVRVRSSWRFQIFQVQSTAMAIPKSRDSRKPLALALLRCALHVVVLHKKISRWRITCFYYHHGFWWIACQNCLWISRRRKSRKISRRRISFCQLQRERRSAM